MGELETMETWQTRARGTNEDEYQIYLDCANDGKGGDIMVKKDGKLRKKINTIIYGSKSEGLYWNQRKRARKTYEEIGTDEGLNKETLSRYTYYMMKRWGGSEELKWDMLLNGQIVLRWG